MQESGKEQGHFLGANFIRIAGIERRGDAKTLSACWPTYFRPSIQLNVAAGQSQVRSKYAVRPVDNEVGQSLMHSTGNVVTRANPSLTTNSPFSERRFRSKSSNSSQVA